MLEVDTNPNLEILFCSLNSILSLDLGNNGALSYLNCFSNQLTELDLKNGNNVNLNFADGTNNPNLTCIEVDDASWSSMNWINIDGTATFSEDCGALASLEEANLEIRISPNPTKGMITIDLSYEVDNIKVIDGSGRILRTYFQKVNSLDLSDLENGIYYLTFSVSDQKITQRIVKY
ncbi:MAG: T9SS type A sorting domain-containing protein [Crocinitomicaceae bacterium]|nr:T9SS type A sorting domain-containing protein [Crocinitomicaceae bacterium]